MKNILIVVLVVLPFYNQLIGQTNIAQQVDYNIIAKLDNTQDYLDVDIDLKYYNNSANDLDTIYFRLDANKFSNKQSAYAEYLIQSNNLKLHFAKKDQLGYYKNLEFSQSNILMNFKYLSSDSMIIAIALEETLQSKSSQNIQISYKLKIPILIDNLGKLKNYYKFYNWYPTAVNFYNNKWDLNKDVITVQNSPYGDYKVKIILDHKFIVVTNASQINKDSVLEQRIKFTKENYNRKHTAFPLETKLINRDIRFNAKNINKFIWVCSPDFLVHRDTIPVQSEEIILTQFYKRKNPIPKLVFENILNDANTIIGKYPYKQLNLLSYSCNGSIDSNPGIIFIPSIKKRNIKLTIATQLAALYVKYYLQNNTIQDQKLIKGLSSLLAYKLSHNKNLNNHYSKICSINNKPKSFNDIDDKQCIKRKSYTLIEEELRLGAIFELLSNYIGTNEFQESLKEFFITYKHKAISSHEFIAFMASKNNINLNSFDKAINQTEKQMDYSILDVFRTPEGYQITIENDGALNLPIRLVGYSDYYTQVDTLLSGFEGIATITLKTDEVKEFILDPNQSTIDIDISNQYIKTKGLFKKSRKYKGYKKNLPVQAKYKYYSLWPYMGYNKTDGFQLGLAFYNHPKAKQYNPYILIAPLFGFKSQKLNGFYNMHMNWEMNKTFVDNIKLGVNYKSFHFQNGISKYDNEEYNLRYQKIDPFIKVFFSVSDRSIIKSITFRSIQLLEDAFEYRTYEVDGKEIVTFSGISPNHYSRIERFSFDYANFSGYTKYTSCTTLEYQNYESVIGEQQYLKLSTSIKTNIFYRPRKKISLRVFAAGFLINSRRESTSTFNVFTRGSISLFSQGYTDYTYDQLYTDRINQSNDNTFVNRTQGGGFSVGIGSQWGLGSTNNFAMAVNLKSDLPFNTFKLPFKAYLDIGVTNQYNYNTSGFENEILYVSGIELDIRNGMIEVFFPIIQSKSIRNILDERGGYFKSISFSVNLDKITTANN